MQIDDIIGYMEMCQEERVQTLQRGMNFRINPNYSLILMSRKDNAVYSDKILEDGITIEYEGHDVPKKLGVNPKLLDQKIYTEKGTITQNGKFINSIEAYKKDIKSKPEIVKVYEKILPGVWSFKGFFELLDYYITFDGKRNVFKFILKLSENNNYIKNNNIKLEHTRIIPSEVKKEVWKRDNGKCVLCGSNKNLHFDHELPFSKGGTSISGTNIRLLCMLCNLKKSSKIE